MALTPDDVVNQRFQQTKFREGYDQDEVDDFLDLVALELRRLIAENDELRTQLTQQGSDPATPVAPEAPTEAPAAEVVDVVEEAPAEPEFSAPEFTEVVAEEVVTEPVVEADVAVAAEAPAGHVGESNRLLVMASELHDRYVEEGRQKGDVLLTEARQKGDVLLSEAQKKSDALVAEAQGRADQVLRDGEQREREQIALLETERDNVQKKIDELRVFERDYRDGLKGYIEGQLSELVGGAPVAN